MAALVVLRARSASAALALLLGVIIFGIGIADLDSIESANALVEPAWGIYAVIVGGALLAVSGFALLLDRRASRA